MSDVRLPPSNADASAAGIKAGDEIEVSRTFAMLCKVILSVMMIHYHYHRWWLLPLVCCTRRSQQPPSGRFLATLNVSVSVRLLDFRLAC